MNIKLLKPIGFCYGVINAINYALKIKEKHQDKNVYIYGLLVHNNDVPTYLETKGIHTINNSKQENIALLNKFNKNDVIIFTAHGHKKIYEDILNKNGVTYYDAICPRVNKNKEIIESNPEDVIYIGKKGHAEVEACLSNKENIFLYDIKNGFDYSKIKSSSPIVINQTTLSFLEIKEIHDDIKKHIPAARILEEICDATKIRQELILNINEDFDLLIIVGSKLSSNSSKLYELAINKHGKERVIFIENKMELNEFDYKKYENIIIASGTSTPIESVNEIIEKLTNL